MSATLAQLKAKEEMEDDIEECEFRGESYFGKHIARQAQEALKKKRKEEKQREEIIEMHKRSLQEDILFESHTKYALLKSIIATPASAQETADNWEDILDNDLPSKNICLICREDKEDFQPKVVMQCCQRQFHSDCLKGCRTRSCPNCRQIFLLAGAKK